MRQLAEPVHSSLVELLDTVRNTQRVSPPLSLLSSPAPLLLFYSSFWAVGLCVGLHKHETTRRDRTRCRLPRKRSTRGTGLERSRRRQPQAPARASRRRWLRKLPVRAWVPHPTFGVPCRRLAPNLKEARRGRPSPVVTGPDRTMPAYACRVPCLDTSAACSPSSARCYSPWARTRRRSRRTGPWRTRWKTSRRSSATACLAATRRCGHMSCGRPARPRQQLHRARFAASWRCLVAGCAHASRRPTSESLRS